MTNRKFDDNTERDHEEIRPARRSLLVGTGALLVGGVTGHASAQQAETPTADDSAPPLPWEWAKIDPMEAATRTYHAYLNQGG